MARKEALVEISDRAVEVMKRELEALPGVGYLMVLFDTAEGGVHFKSNLNAHTLRVVADLLTQRAVQLEARRAGELHF